MSESKSEPVSIDHAAFSSSDFFFRSGMQIWNRYLLISIGPEKTSGNNPRVRVEAVCTREHLYMSCIVDVDDAAIQLFNTGALREFSLGILSRVNCVGKELIPRITSPGVGSDPLPAIADQIGLSATVGVHIGDRKYIVSVQPRISGSLVVLFLSAYDREARATLTGTYHRLAQAQDIEPYALINESLWRPILPRLAIAGDGSGRPYPQGYFLVVRPYLEAHSVVKNKTENGQEQMLLMNIGADPLMQHVLVSYYSPETSQESSCLLRHQNVASLLKNPVAASEANHRPGNAIATPELSKLGVQSLKELASHAVKFINHAVQKPLVANRNPIPPLQRSSHAGLPIFQPIPILQAQFSALALQQNRVGRIPQHPNPEESSISALQLIDAIKDDTSGFFSSLFHPNLLPQTIHTAKFQLIRFLTRLNEQAVELGQSCAQISWSEMAEYWGHRQNSLVEHFSLSLSLCFLVGGGGSL